MRSRRFLNKSDTSWKYPAKIFVRRSIFHRKNIYRSIIIEVNLEVLRSRHIKRTKFRSRCCFCVRHEKRTDKLSVRQQSIYCTINARNALSRKHCETNRLIFYLALPLIFLWQYRLSILLSKSFPWLLKREAYNSYFKDFQ